MIQDDIINELQYIPETRLSERIYSPPPLKKGD